jgi:hypothetical protein
MFFATALIGIGTRIQQLFLAEHLVRFSTRIIWHLQVPRQDFFLPTANKIHIFACFCVMRARQLTTRTFLMVTMFSQRAMSTTLEGVELPEFRTVGGVQLKRNGHGIRSISFLGLPIKIYVAGFYSSWRLQDAKAVLDCHLENSPLQLDFTFLRSVSGSQCASAWSKQLENSVSHRYDGYEKDRDDFIGKLSSPIAKGGTISIQMIGDDTVVMDQGVDKGVVSGRNFQLAFLSMWFGDRPVTDDLKAGLLHGGVHLEPTPVLA